MNLDEFVDLEVGDKLIDNKQQGIEFEILSISDDADFFEIKRIESKLLELDQMDVRSWFEIVKR